MLEWKNTCDTYHVVVEELALPGNATLTLHFFPQYPDGHRHKASWQLFARVGENPADTREIANGVIRRDPTLEEAKAAAIRDAREWLIESMEYLTALSSALRTN